MSTAVLTAAELKQAQKMPDDEKSKRALYFCVQLARHCLELIQQLVSDFRPVKVEGGGTSPQVLQAGGNGTSPQMLEAEYRHVVKELLALSILMTLVQQSREGDRSEWLDNFFQRVFSSADHIYSKPTCEAVFELYAPEAQLSDMCLAIAMSLGYKMHLPSDNEVTMGVGLRLFEAQHDRSTILRDALKAAAGDLDGLVREPLPMVIV